MIGEVIKEYLVGLGVRIDKPGFKEMESTINQTSHTISSATGGWAKNFVTAAGIIGTAIASISASVVGLMTAAAKQDLAMEKYARQMLVSKSAALEMKQAIDALGESVQDIQITPELFARYKALVADGRNMKVGGDHEGTMKNFRDLIFEFTRLKQEASYAMQWVGYYLMKYLSRPLEDAKKSFKNINESLIKSMPVWTEKIARALVYIINVGRHFWDLLKAIGETIYNVWDAFPRGIKIATAALAGFWLVLKASPVGRMIALIGSLLILVDDYFGYMEGKKAAMGSVWDKLNGYIDTGKRKLVEWGRELSPIWDSFVDYLGKAKDGAIDFSEKIGDWIDKVQHSKGLRDFVDTVKRLGKALQDLGGGIIDFLAESFKSLMKSFEKQDGANKFTDLMQKLWDVFLGLIDTISYCCEVIGNWLREVAKSEIVQDLIDALVELFGALMDLIGAFSGLCDVALREFFGGVGKTQPVYSFRDAVRAVVKMITAMIRGVSKLIRWLSDLFKMMADNRTFKAFWKGIGEVAGEFFNIVMKALGAVGRLGQALMALVRGDWRGAKRLAGSAVDKLFGSSKAEAGGRRKGTGFSGTGDTQRDEWILEASRKYGVPPEKIAAMIEAESSFIAGAVSEAGCIGYMQLDPSTAQGLGMNPYDDHENILGGTKYMAQLYEKYGDWDSVYAAYNCGPGKFDEVMANNGFSGLPSETRNHVNKVRNNEGKYFAEIGSQSYVIQNGVEDFDLTRVNGGLKSKFDSLTELLSGKGYDVEVTSGWRSEENNAAVNGVPNSKHLDGEAIDFIIKNEFDQQDVEELIRQAGLNILYHDAGSGNHFHVESGLTESEEHSALYNTVEAIGKSANSAGESFFDFAGDVGGWMTNGVNNIDPFIMKSIKNMAMSPAYSNCYSGGTTNINVDVGGVNVQNSNASADDIGRAVGDRAAESMEDRSLYVLQNRTLGGGVSWV